MKKLKELNRNRMLKTLSNKRQRLIKKGAKPEEIESFFGVGLGTKFGDLSNSRLSLILNKTQEYKVSVVNGNILPEKYIRARKHINKDLSNLTTTYKNSLKSTFLRDRNIKETRKRLKEHSKNAKQNYIKNIENYLDNDTLNDLKKMSDKDFYKMIKNSNGLIDFSRVFIDSNFIGVNEQGVIDDYIHAEKTAIAEDVRNTLQAYKKSKKRNRIREKIFDKIKIFKKGEPFKK